MPYLPSLSDYYVQDDFGVIQLLSTKPAASFFRWFVSTWMDDIWGYTPDEVRPFTALTYQIAAIWGVSSPIPNHIITIAFHVANSLLVFSAARWAAGLRPLAAVVAAVVFAVLPMQSESVAWITGRVDSVPTCFYLAAFLLYARWRASGRQPLYLWSVFFCFVALFSKQNTITLAPALVLYDAIVARRAVRASWAWLRPYAPFVVLTIGYLALRYALFGEVAREGRLTAAGFEIFRMDLSTHLKRMVFGEPGLRMPGRRMALYVGLATTAIVAAGWRFGGSSAGRLIRPAVFFGIVWIAVGVAPTLVAGYASPRHMYLASVGWAVAIGVAFEALWQARPLHVAKPLAALCTALLLGAYLAQLGSEVRAWHMRSEVSRRAVADVEREVVAAPAGTLVLAGAPRSSWDFALPHALRPPYTREDLTRRASVISHSSLHCCAADQWEQYTRGALRKWLSDPARPPVVALYWDPAAGTSFRVAENDEPFLRPLMTILLGTEDVAALDEGILDVFDQLAPGRLPAPLRRR